MGLLYNFVGIPKCTRSFFFVAQLALTHCCPHYYRHLKDANAVDQVVVHVNTNTVGEKHLIYFNRGVAGSQAYARKFGHVSPTNLKPAAKKESAFKWLSRGLEEAIFGSCTSMPILNCCIVCLF